MPKDEIIKEMEEWLEENMPDKEIDSAEFESKHASGQHNYAIYTASDDKIIQENDDENEDKSKHHEFEYTAH